MTTTPSSNPDQNAKSGNWFTQHKLLTAILAIVVLIIIGGAIGGGGKDDADAKGADSNGASTSVSDKAADENADEAKVGDAITAGDLSVTVTNVEAGLKRIGDEHLGSDAQGQYVKVSVSVTNNGKEATYFTESDQHLIDDQDRQHSTSGDSIYLGNDSVLFEQINPGNTVEGIMLFDIPADATPKAVEIDTGLLSNPVRVNVQ